jgi:signal transduction histidine kinase
MKTLDKDSLRNKLMGLGEESMRKSYYAELLEKSQDLELKNKELTLQIQKRAEAEIELKKFNEGLEAIVAERTQSLTLLNQQLVVSLDQLKMATEALFQDEKNRALTTLMIGLSHEINTPLGVCITSSSYHAHLLELLKSESEKCSINPQLTELIDELVLSNVIIQRNLETNRSLISDIQGIFEDQIHNSLKTFDVIAYTHTILKTFKSQLDHQSITVKIIEPPIPLIVIGSPGLLSRILTHLLNDSLIHAFPNIVSPHIEIRFEMDSEIITLHYCDNGIGIDESLISKVFDPFYTMARTKKKVGLGLYGLKYLLEDKLGGTICLISSKGKGVHFIIKTPLGQQDEN